MFLVTQTRKVLQYNDFIFIFSNICNRLFERNDESNRDIEENLRTNDG